MAREVEELVRQCLSGDEAAVRRFVESYQQAIFGVCLRMLRHRQDAEDAAQETLLRAITNLHRWDPERPILPWLLAIAANRCRTAMEVRSRRPRTPGLLPESVAGSNGVDRELGEELDRAIRSMRDEYQATFVLFYQQHWSCAQISESMGVPEGTVKTWLHRARRELAETLQRRGIVPEGKT